MYRQFPWKLHEMLREQEEGFQHNNAVSGDGVVRDPSIVSWLDHGKAFRVHKPHEFVKKIMPQYFRQSHYKSFQRQLNLWGFERTVSKGPEYGAYYHKYFIRGQPGLCGYMTRQKIKGVSTSNSAASSSSAPTPAVSSSSEQHAAPSIESLRRVDGTSDVPNHRGVTDKTKGTNSATPPKASSSVEINEVSDTSSPSSSPVQASKASGASFNPLSALADLALLADNKGAKETSKSGTEARVLSKSDSNAEDRASSVSPSQLFAMAAKLTEGPSATNREEAKQDPTSAEFSKERKAAEKKTIQSEEKPNKFSSSENQERKPSNHEGGAGRDSRFSGISNNNNSNVSAPAPKRPLSAYNIFFEYQRNRIIAGESTDEKPDSEEFIHCIESILSGKTYHKKKAKNASDAVPSLQELTRQITPLWKSLDPVYKAILDCYAGQEMRRYETEVKLWRENRSSTSWSSSGLSFANAESVGDTQKTQFKGDISGDVIHALRQYGGDIHSTGIAGIQGQQKLLSNGSVAGSLGPLLDNLGSPSAANYTAVPTATSCITSLVAANLKRRREDQAAIDAMASALLRRQANDLSIVPNVSGQHQIQHEIMKATGIANVDEILRAKISAATSDKAVRRDSLMESVAAASASRSVANSSMQGFLRPSMSETSSAAAYEGASSLINGRKMSLSTRRGSMPLPRLEDNLKEEEQRPPATKRAKTSYVIAESVPSDRNTDNIDDVDTASSGGVARDTVKHKQATSEKPDTFDDNSRKRDPKKQSDSQKRPVSAFTSVVQEMHPQGDKPSAQLVATRVARQAESGCSKAFEASSGAFQTGARQLPSIATRPILDFLRAGVLADMQSSLPKNPASSISSERPILGFLRGARSVQAEPRHSNSVDEANRKYRISMAMREGVAIASSSAHSAIGTASATGGLPSALGSFGVSLPVTGGTDFKVQLGADSSQARSDVWEPRDKPKNPMSSIDIFTEIERKRIVSGATKAPSTDEFIQSIEEVLSASSHSNVSVSQEQSGEIGEKWKKIDPDFKALLECYAAKDMARYRNERKLWEMTRGDSFNSSTQFGQSKSENETRETDMGREEIKNSLPFPTPYWLKSEKQSLPFPFALHNVLRYAELEGKSSVVSWLPHGKAFKVHSKEQFVATMMSLYFKQTKFKSFQRQLNLWGFTRMTEGPDAGAYYHKFFLKDQPALCKMMTRQKIKNPASPAKTTNTPTKPTETPTESTDKSTPQKALATEPPLGDLSFLSTLAVCASKKSAASLSKHSGPEKGDSETRKSCGKDMASETGGSKQEWKPNLDCDRLSKRQGSTVESRDRAILLSNMALKVVEE